MDREVLVYADWDGLDGLRIMGTLRVIKSRGSEVFSFSYDADWLASPPSAALDPDLQLFEGPQYLADNHRPNFGIFLDSCPDRWGRALMRRRESALARKEEREPRRLGEADYLLGVRDEQRMGALRFRIEESDHFLSDDAVMATPPWTSLRELEHASWQLQDDDHEMDGVMLGWLNLLIARGSSLGGARPKAGIHDPEGDLWIAKFPGRSDERDMGAWEWVTWQLAHGAGVIVPEAKILQLARQHHTFLTRRFDRVGGSKGTRRLHFSSAMTMLGYNDGASHDQGISYLEMVEFLSNQGGDVTTDLEQLWRRIVFSICVSNTDDHLRNHGFLLTEEGWKLAPAYDLNPDPYGKGLSLNITEDDNALEIDLALEVAPHFRLKPSSAEEIVSEVRAAVSRWRTLAAKCGLPRRAIEEMHPAFTA